MSEPTQANAQSRPPQQRRENRPSRPPQGPRERNTIFIGNKPPMNYVLAVVTQFNQGEPEVVIKARGKAISQAVDVAEIVRNKFFQKASVKNVAIATEQVVGEDGRKRMVSAIEIRLENTDTAGAVKATTAAANLPQAHAPQKAPAEPVTPPNSAAV